MIYSNYYGKLNGAMEDENKEINENLDSDSPHIEKEPLTDKQQKKKSTIKYVLNISVVLIITIVALVISLWGDKFQAAVDNLSSAKWQWILVIFAVFGASLLIKGFIIFCFARLYVKKYSIIRGLAVDQVDIFYSAVTPGATGGQVGAGVTLSKQGIPVSSAVSMVAMMSIVYQLVIILYGMLAFIIKFQDIIAIGGFTFTIGNITIMIPMIALTIIGFFLNLIIIGVVFLMAYWRGFHHFILGPCVSFLVKLHLCRNPEKVRENLRIQVENFKIEFRRLLTNIPFTILAVVLYFVYFTVKFSIPYFVGTALGNMSSTANFWDAVFLSNYHLMVTNLIPIPGSAGVSELFFRTLFLGTAQNPGFYAMFTPEGVYDETASNGLVTAALLLWRTVTFTLPLIIAGFVTAFYKPKKGGISVREAIPDIPTRQTFLTMQQETYVDRKRETDTLIETRRLSKDAVLKKLKSKDEEERIPMEDEIMSIEVKEEKETKKHWWNRKK